MNLFGLTPRQKVTRTHIEQKLPAADYINGASAGQLRKLVSALDKSGVPDNARVYSTYVTHYAKWDDKEYREDVG